MRIVRFVFVLALSLGGASSAFADDAALMKSFFDSDYTQCDVHFVMKTFEFSRSDAKVYIGQKIAWGTTAILDDDLERARDKGKTDRTWRCQFYQTGYSYDDALALATYWGVDVSEAKARVEQKILDGNEAFFAKQVLPDARATQSASMMEADAAMASEDDAHISTFLKSEVYDACHAKMLIGTYFGTGIQDVKATFGRKISMGIESTIESELDKVRKKHQTADTVPCSFHETRYTTDDAVALAKLWGQETQEAKARVERKYAWGQEDILREELQRAKKP